LESFGRACAKLRRSIVHARTQFTQPANGTKPNGVARRSERSAAPTAVMVKGTSKSGVPYSVSTDTLVISAHGCLVRLATPFTVGEQVVLRNLGTLQEQRCAVAYVGKVHDGYWEVGLRFEDAVPEFWGVSQLPDTCH
jgi:hypothetical protein